MAVLGLRFCARAFSSCGKRGPLFIAVRGPLTVAASLVAEHRLQTRRLSSCGSRAQLLRGMWDPPRPGLEPVSPALAGRLSTTVPPGKPKSLLTWLPIYYKGYNSGIVRRRDALCQEWDEDQIYISYYKSQYHMLLAWKSITWLPSVFQRLPHHPTSTVRSSLAITFYEQTQFT